MARMQRPSSSPSRPPLRFTVDAPCLLNFNKCGVRELRNCHLFGYYTPQPGVDDIHFSMSLFNATPHVLAHDPTPVKT